MPANTVIPAKAGIQTIPTAQCSSNRPLDTNPPEPVQ
jgi:hypothetical protein